MKVKLEDVIEAMEMTDKYSEYFLDKQTGEIEWVSDMAMSMVEREKICNRLDEHGFYRLPSSLDIREYDLMNEFIHGLPESVQGQVLSTIRGKGAFRRFKEMLTEMGILQEWYKFRENAFKQLAAKWCRENDIVFYTEEGTINTLKDVSC